MSRVRTRALRFLSTFKYFLTSIFVSTILFDLFYPASTCSTFNMNPYECSSAPSRLPYGEFLSLYHSLTNVCSLRPPPRSIPFLLIVALVTISIMVPYTLLFYMVLVNICSKLPCYCLWFGTEDSQPNYSPLNDATINDRVNRLHAICPTLESGGVQFALRKLGLRSSINGELQLTLLFSLRFKDVPDCIQFNIKRSVKDAQRILNTMESIPDVSQRSSYLIQHALFWDAFILFLGYLCTATLAIVLLICPNLFTRLPGCWAGRLSLPRFFSFLCGSYSKPLLTITMLQLGHQFYSH